MNELKRLTYEELRSRLDGLVDDRGASSETRALIHELEVHQVELEMQNRELREAHEVLESSRDRYAVLYDLAPVGYLTLEPTAIIHELNLTAAALLGTELNKAIGASLLKWVEPADKSRLLRHLGTQLGSSAGAGLDLRLRLRGGGTRHVRLHTLHAEDPAMATQIIRAAMIDTTEQERAQAALRASELRFRAIFENAAVGMALVALSGCLLEVNQRLCAILGYTPQELVGRYMQDLIYPEDMPFQLENATLLRNGEIDRYNLEERHLRKDGSVVWVNSTAALLREADGRADYFGVVVEDITARKRAEEELLAADRRKDEFLMMLGHELRNPLAPIRSAAEALCDGLANDARKVRWAADIIARQVGHMTRLVDDLLDVSRITHGSIRLQKAPCDLREAVELGVEQTRPLLAERRQKLVLALPAEPVNVHADAVRLAQVISNLLVNASKFSPQDSNIELELKVVRGTAQIQVRDHGVGIPSDMLGRIFEPYFQARQASDRPTGGIGLGLALSKGLVLMHGGFLDAASPGTGQGSTFTLRLPLGTTSNLAEAEAEAAAPKPVAEAKADDSLVILIVDDNRDVAEACSMLLSLAGHRTHTASDGRAALATSADLKPDVILLDIGLPGMDGFEVARRLRATPAGEEAAILAVSGYDLGRMPARDAALFDGHLLKPVGLKALLATIERCR